MIHDQTQKVSILRWRCAEILDKLEGACRDNVFQFSVGDATVSMPISLPLAIAVQFQFSVGDAGFLGLWIYRYLSFSIRLSA